MSVFSKIFKIFGDANERTVKRLAKTVEQINALEPQMKALSDEELKGLTAIFKQRLADGASLDDIMPEAFAAVRSAGMRALGQRHFDAQLMGGMVLHEGGIAEMKTGEGKTLVATLAAYLNALAGKGVHVVTVNDYLSRRDAVWMGKIFYQLGLSTACINHEASYVYDPEHVNAKESEDEEKKREETASFRVLHEFLRPVSRRQAYEADITYGTNNEYGFDYLRDNMVADRSEMVQAQGHHFAIVDEIDSILIDEARTPLIISAPDNDSTTQYQMFAGIVPRLQENEDYDVDEKLKAVSITEKGIEKIEQVLKIKNIYEEGGVSYVHHLEQALKAHVLFHRDKEYVVKDGEVIIVDEFTGRLMPGRRWSAGLHQAVEAKEKVYVQKESKTLATITFQNYFRLYGKLSGMTGTAQTSAEEFHKVYELNVVSIPPNRPMVRKDLPDRIYKTENGKFQAIVQEVKERHAQGQSVLIGTVSIQKNELLSKFLEREGIPHKVLNAKNHEQEGEIIAQAGRLGAVTVATNMAGRGVDILLGGNPVDANVASKVRDGGGLHVIGTERHEARRIDDQLRGRAGRQGDPGSSQFFVSTDDTLARIFGGDRLRSIMDTLGVPEDEAIENGFVSRAIEQAQGKIEGHNFDSRKQVLDYDDVMNKHRETIYRLRREILDADDSSEKIKEYIYNELDMIVDVHTSDQGADWNTEEIAENVQTIASINDLHASIHEIAETKDKTRLNDFLYEALDTAYAQREQDLGTDVARHLEKMVALRVIDGLWVDHLDEMEHLRDSVNLRAYAQRDPLVEYKIEGQRLFAQLQAEIGSQIAHTIFKVSAGHQHQRRSQPIQITNSADIKAMPLSAQPQQQSAGGQQPQRPIGQAHTPQRSNEPKLGRNDPCFCGSGKKYKKCHGA